MNLNELLLKFAFFKDFSENEIKNIQSIVNVVKYSEGDLIFEEDSIGEEMFFLLSGEIEIFKRTSDGNKIVLTTIDKEGDFFGEMSLVDGKPRSASVRAIKQTSLLLIEKKKLLSLPILRPEIYLKILDKLSVRLRDFDQKYIQDILTKNKELEKANRELMKLDELKTKFITMASHELKTPLTCINAGIELLQDEDYKKIDENQFKLFFSIIIRNANRLNRLIGKIIMLAKGEFLNRSVEKEQIELSFILEELFSEFSNIVKKRNLNLEKNITLKDEKINANREEIYQIMSNLLMNAVKYTKDGGKIEIYSNSRDGQIELGVIDNGIGIPKDELENIFKPFYEVKDVNLHKSGEYEFDASGLGIGLAIVKTFAEANNGMVFVESEVGKGSKFYVRFPRVS